MFVLSINRVNSYSNKPNISFENHLNSYQREAILRESKRRRALRVMELSLGFLGTRWKKLGVKQGTIDFFISRKRQRMTDEINSRH